MTADETIKGIINYYANANDIEITDHSTNNEMGIDSLTLICIVEDIEHKFGITVSDGQFDELKEYKDYLKLTALGG